MNANETQAFMWETFTTKPYHDSGECTRLGDISTPWPCFMVAGLHDVINTKLDSIRNALSAIHEAASIFHESKDTMPNEISKKYSLELKDAREWYNGVSCPKKNKIIINYGILLFNLFTFSFFLF